MPLYRVPIPGFILLVLSGALTLHALRSSNPPALRLIRWFWPLYALSQIILAAVVFGSHLFFPLNLEFMESTVLQHVMRLSAGQPIYADPSPGFVALAYNPLFYAVCVPFVRVLGPTLVAVRVPAMLASLAVAILIGLLLKNLTRSNWWAGVGVGVFAAAYRVMDCYLDVGHRDSLLLLSILNGFWFLHRAKEHKALLPMGIAILATGFWFKQTGLFFLGMGIAYALWQFPWRSAVPAALLGLALGPVLYAFAPEAWFGPRLHYFTFEVPRQWTALYGYEVSNLCRLLFWHYGALVLPAVWLWVRGWRKPSGSLGVLRMAIPGAFASGAAIMMTPGSSNNVYIPMGALLIVGGVTGLARLSRAGTQGRRIAYALLALVFAPMLYRPQTVMASPDAPRVYGEFTNLLHSLDGPVYGPGLGPIFDQPGYPPVHLTPLVHVVPMADIVRGPGRDETAVPIVRSLLHSVEHPDAPVAYIMSHSTLEDEPTLAYLNERYRLEKDFGKQFEALATLPAKHGHLYPRYLYKLKSTAGPESMAMGGAR